jgi:O-antigen ligase
MQAINPRAYRLPPRHPGRVRTVAQQRLAASRQFWDCRLTKLEFVLLALVTFLAGTLHLAPVLHSDLGLVLTYLLPAVSYLSPITGFFFIACSQFLPYPEGSPHNPAQAGVLVWLPMILMRYRRLNLRSAWRLWPVLPWLLWLWTLTQEPIYRPNGDYVKALVYAIIACQLANESKGRFQKCLLGLCLGAFVVMTAYWANELGLPVEISDWGNEREGFTRMGAVRADAVMVWPALLLAISGLVGLQIAFASRRSPAPSPRWLIYGTLILSVASLPPLISTMSHGAYVGFVLVAVALTGAGWVAGKEGAFNNPKFRMLLKWGGLGLAVVIALFVTDAFQLRTKVASLDRYYKEVSSESGLAASRTGVWHDSIHTIMQYPLFGIRMTGDQEEITSEYASQGWYLSHNVFLDYGRSIGLPGMFLLGFFFFWPVVKMWKSPDRVRYLPFILAHFAMFIFWMSLSFTFYKTFWALWMLLAMAAPGTPFGATSGRKFQPAAGINQGRQQFKRATHVVQSTSS